MSTRPNRGMTESEPEPGIGRIEIPQRSVLPHRVLSFGGSTGGSRQHPTEIQNDSGLAQRLAGRSAAG
jgi:hypothetical protein